MSALGIRTIIVATDLSDALKPALHAGVRLAKLTDAHLHIVHTTEARMPESAVADHVRAAGIEVGGSIEARIIVGPPGAVLVQDAVRVNADVIVLGPHQPGHSRLGSTAYRVVLGAKTPCLMLPTELSLPLTRVLVPIDMSASPEGPLRLALTWATALRHRHHSTEFVALSVGTHEETPGTMTKSMLHEIEAICQPLKTCVGLDIMCRALAGSPPEVILDVADNMKADLIVMGTRGEDLQRDALGSVSREVVSRAKQPVLLVPRAVWNRQE